MILVLFNKIRQMGEKTKKRRKQPNTHICECACLPALDYAYRKQIVLD